MSFPSFSTGEVLTAADMNAVGLWLVGSTTFTTSANPFINGCFSSDYQNYRVVINLSGSASSNLRLRVRSGTSTPETTAVYDRWGFSVTGGTLANQTSAAESALFLGGFFSGELTPYTMDVFSPNETKRTLMLPYAWNSATGGTFIMPSRISTNTAYTGLELYADSGTLTGSMRVYGYRN